MKRDRPGGFGLTRRQWAVVVIVLALGVLAAVADGLAQHVGPARTVTHPRSIQCKYCAGSTG
jgi:hypothetical protein